MAERFRKALGRKGTREQPQGRQLLRSQPIEQVVQSVAESLSVTAEELAEYRRPLRDVPIFLLWDSVFAPDNTVEKCLDGWTFDSTTAHDGSLHNHAISRSRARGR